MKPVIQEETTGCGIAASAALAGVSYQQAKQTANALGIFADDKSLWSDTQYIRHLLIKLGINTRPQQTSFINWNQLPDKALLATKWHQQDGRSFWHWAVFVRDGHNAYVLDSKQALKHHTRTDFGRIKPKWFIEVYTSK